MTEIGDNATCETAAPGEPGRPPVELESWIDFIIASAAHRSSNAGHQKFGDALVQRYFVSLPERFKEDKVATAYFDHMLLAVAAAVRGFSVVRDIFQTNWDSLKAGRDAGTKQAERYELFAPLKKDGRIGQAIAAVLGIGVGAPLTQALKSKLGNSPIVALLFIAGAIVISLLVLEVLVEWLRSRELTRVERSYPADLLTNWEEKSLKGYQTVLKQFLPLAIEITNRYYPGSFGDSMADEEIAALIERHFAFKSKKAAMPQSAGNTARA